MNAWSNIEVSPTDPEIVEIDKLEKSIGDISPEVQQVRELITRFEVCHFKYQKHLEAIKESIQNLEPSNDPSAIGSNHIQKGESAWRKDKTGKSLLGQQYLWGLRSWLTDNTIVEDPAHANKELISQVAEWLGGRTAQKERLVRLLIARLTWDWKSYEEFKKEKENKELEYQVIRMDICHYAFPENLDSVIKGIGELKPVKEFEGCGSHSSEIRDYIEKEILTISDILKSHTSADHPDKQDHTRRWLTCCLMKTLKEQAGLAHQINEGVKAT